MYSLAMSAKPRSLLEGNLTAVDAADIGTYEGVSVHVLFDVLLVGKKPSTNITLEPFLVKMHALQMALQTELLGQLLSTPWNDASVHFKVLSFIYRVVQNKIYKLLLIVWNSVCELLQEPNGR